MNASDQEARVVADFAGDVRRIRPDLVRKANRLLGLRATFAAAAFAAFLDLTLFAIAARAGSVIPSTSNVVSEAPLRYFYEKKATDISELDSTMAKTVVGPLSSADYDAALIEIERYFDSEPTPGTPEADRFDLLALVIEDYERKHWPIAPK